MGTESHRARKGGAPFGSRRYKPCWSLPSGFADPAEYGAAAPDSQITYRIGVKEASDIEQGTDQQPAKAD